MIEQRSGFDNTIKYCLLARGLLDHRVLDEARAFAIVVEGHGEVSPALGEGAEVGDVAEHLGQRDLAVDLLGVAPLRLPGHVAAAAGDVADYVAVVLFGDGDLDLHDRLKEDRVAFGGGGLQGEGGGDLVGGFRGVDVVVGPVEEGGLDVD